MTLCATWLHSFIYSVMESFKHRPGKNITRQLDQFSPRVHCHQNQSTGQVRRSKPWEPAQNSFCHDVVGDQLYLLHCSWISTVTPSLVYTTSRCSTRSVLFKSTEKSPNRLLNWIGRVPDIETFLKPTFCRLRSCTYLITLSWFFFWSPYLYYLDSCKFWLL